MRVLIRVCMYVFVCECIGQNVLGTAILIIIEGQFQAFQRFSSSNLVLKIVESCFAALNYCENGSMYVY